MNIISPEAKIGKNVTFGNFVTVYDDVVIGDNSVIESYCEIGYPTDLATRRPLIIGSDSKIRSHSIFYQGSIFGHRLITGHHVTVRENTIAGENLQIGTLCDIQGDCVIGDYVRFHSNVHIGKKSKIGNFVWIFPYVVLTNDPTPPSENLLGVVVEDYVSIATMSVILPGVTIGSGSLVGAHSLVTKSVPPGMVACGNPAINKGPASEIKLRDGSNQPAYPWTKHFHRGYPKEVIKKWITKNENESE